MYSSESSYAFPIDIFVIISIQVKCIDITIAIEKNCYSGFRYDFLKLFQVYFFGKEKKTERKKKNRKKEKKQKERKKKNRKKERKNRKKERKSRKKERKKEKTERKKERKKPISVMFVGTGLGFDVTFGFRAFYDCGNNKSAWGHDASITLKLLNQLWPDIWSPRAQKQVAHDAL